MVTADNELGPHYVQIVFAFSRKSKMVSSEFSYAITHFIIVIQFSCMVCYGICYYSYCNIHIHLKK